MLPRQLFLRLLIAGFVVSVPLFCAASALAQSGRRGQKSQPPPVATPTPIPKAPEKKDAPAVTFFIGVDRYQGFSTIPLYFYGKVADECAERLDEAPGAKAEVATQEVNRTDAVRKAKAMKEGFVVFLLLKVENGSDDASVVNNLEQIYLEYTVFAATTAKIAAWGHTYQQGYRKGGVVVDNRTPGRGNPVRSEYLLKQAAREAADRILEALKMGISPQPIATRN
ncbi:MAG: hypothetical protein AABM67_17650 [Acidobacteriota bacterium]